MNSPFEGIHHKIRRARHHRKAVDLKVGDFVRAQPYAVVTQVDAETGEQVWSATGDVSQLPPSISASAGDALYNYRSVLDHLAWRLVEISGGVPDTRTMFPVYADSVQFVKRGWRRLNGMDGRFLADVIRLQPCFGTSYHRDIFLWSLERLVSIDKHRYLSVLTASSAGGAWEPGSAMGQQINVHLKAGQHDTEIARFPPHQVDVQFFPTPRVAFSEPHWLPYGGDVGPVLLGIESAVVEVVNQFAWDYFGGEGAFTELD